MTGSKTKNKNLHISKDKRYFILFNGEIYNHKRLAKKYNISFNEIYSDTYVLVNSFDSKNALKFSELDGMFSIIIYDRVEKKYLQQEIFRAKKLYIYMKIIIVF